MRILVIGHSLHPRWFGGEPRVAHLVLKALKGCGFRVRVMTMPPNVIRWRILAGSFGSDPYTHLYEKYITKFKPSIVMLWYDAVLDSATHLLKLAKKLNFKLVFSIHCHWLWCPRVVYYCLYDKRLNCETCLKLTMLRRAINCTKLYLRQYRRKMLLLKKLLEEYVEHYKIIVPSKFMSVLVHRILGVPRSNIELIYNGVDIDLFKPMAYKASKPTLLFVGALERHKGFHHYLMLVNELKRRGLNVEAYAVGKGSLAYLARRSSIKYYGVVPDNELVRLYSRAWAVIIPSLWPEPFPLVPLEAASCGTVPIAYSVGGLTESCNLVGGLLVKRGSISKLVQTVEELLTNNDHFTIHQRGIACRDKIVKRFRVEHMVNGYIKVISSL